VGDVPAGTGLKNLELFSKIAVLLGFRGKSQNLPGQRKTPPAGAGGVLRISKEERSAAVV
jgi:hypothetical protein